jgi:hypothetical protein
MLSALGKVPFCLAGLLLTTLCWLLKPFITLSTTETRLKVLWVLSLTWPRLMIGWNGLLLKNPYYYGFP